MTSLPAPASPSTASGGRATESTPLQTALLTVHEPQILALPAPFLKTLGVLKGRRRQFFYVEMKAETLVLRTLDDHLQTTLVPRLRDVPRSQVLAAAASPEFSALARRILDLPEAELEPGGNLRIPKEVRLCQLVAACACASSIRSPPRSGPRRRGDSGSSSPTRTSQLRAPPSPPRSVSPPSPTLEPVVDPTA